MPSESEELEQYADQLTPDPLSEVLVALRPHIQDPKYRVPPGCEGPDVVTYSYNKIANIFTRAYKKRGKRVEVTHVRVHTDYDRLGNRISVEVDFIRKPDEELSGANFLIQVKHRPWILNKPRIEVV